MDDEYPFRLPVFPPLEHEIDGLIAERLERIARLSVATMFSLPSVLTRLFGENVTVARILRDERGDGVMLGMSGMILLTVHVYPGTIAMGGNGSQQREFTYDYVSFDPLRPRLTGAAQNLLLQFRARLLKREFTLMPREDIELGREDDVRKWLWNQGW